MEQVLETVVLFFCQPHLHFSTLKIKTKFWHHTNLNQVLTLYK